MIIVLDKPQPNPSIEPVDTQAMAKISYALIPAHPLDRTATNEMFGDANEDK